LPSALIAGHGAESGKNRNGASATISSDRKNFRMPIVCRRLLFCTALLVASLPSWAGTPPEGRWEPIAEIWDEFDGPRLDSSKWDNNNPYYKGKKPGLFMPNNIQQDNGELSIWARAENIPGAPLGYHSFTTASMTSSQMVQYGYFEVRAKVMRSSVINAFWLYRWTETGTYEIDIFEIAGGARGQAQTIHTNTHVYQGPPELESDRNRISDSAEFNSPVPLADDYHTYGFEWNEKELKWYFDGQLIRTKPNNFWHLPMNIKLSAETFPGWVGLPSKGELPAAFRVEYFRAWRKAADTPARRR
jgi:beta-glucanase (GH16 family)